MRGRKKERKRKKSAKARMVFVADSKIRKQKKLPWKCAGQKKTLTFVIDQESDLKDEESAFL